jgi:hypothetical protein
MKPTPLRRRARLRAHTPLLRTTPLRRTESFGATDSQRAAVAGRPCIVCGATQRVDPMHVIPRSLGGCGDQLCIVPACRRCHRTYDTGELDLLPYLEPAWRAQLAHAVRHVGLIGALRRISGEGSATHDRRATMTSMAVTTKKLDVHIGDVVEIEGRRYDVVSDKEDGVTLEPAITKTVAEIHAEHGERQLSREEFEELVGEVPTDGEG